MSRGDAPREHPYPGPSASTSVDGHCCSLPPAADSSSFPGRVAMPTIPLQNQLRQVAGAPLRRKIRKDRSQFLANAQNACRRTQHAVLKRVLALNADSEFSRHYGLTPDLTVDEFRARIPVSDYELVRPWIDRMQSGEHRALLGAKNRLLMYAVTSATTARSKLIPVTEPFVQQYRRSWQMWAIGAYTQHARLQRLNIMQLSSSHERFTTPDGTPCGNISGLVAAMQTRIVRSMYTVPHDLTRIEDANVKRYMILRLALADPFIGMMITANPGSLTQLFESLQEHAESLIRDMRDGGVAGFDLDPTITRALGRRLSPLVRRSRELDDILQRDGQLSPSACWPHVGLFGVWSGGSVGAYLPLLQRMFPGVPVRDHGLHASEGRMTLPLADNSPAGVLEVETHFFEFMPVREVDSTSPVVLEAEQLEEGEDYFILLTTCSGLYRYNIFDVVRCVGFHGQTPLLEFRHKGAHMSSITGEKIAESQVVEAVRKALAVTSTTLRTFTLTPVWGEPPGYILFVEPNPSIPEGSSDQSRLAQAVDAQLQELNLEYAEKRASDRLQPITVRPLETVFWRQFKATRLSRGGGSEEQYKHPCLLPDPQFESVFEKTCGLAEAD
jgi:hypothetical protein